MYDADFKEKIKIIRSSKFLTDYELPTQKLLFDFCKEHYMYNILYLHTKGVGKSINPCIEDWINYTLYFLVEKYNNALLQLENYMTVGVDLREIPTLHYSGNFWWVKAAFIKELPDPNDFKDLDRRSL